MKFLKNVLICTTLALTGLTTFSTVVSAAPILTAAPWVIAGLDVGGNNWSGSTITFDTQSPSGPDFLVSGYFYWTGNSGTYFGRENFSGTLFASDHLTLLGIGIIPPSRGIISGGTYNADVTADRYHMINGTWGGVGIPSNAWTAAQVPAPVPEPPALVLLLSGLIVLMRGVKKRNVHA